MEKCILIKADPTPVDWRAFRASTGMSRVQLAILRLKSWLDDKTVRFWLH